MLAGAYSDALEHELKIDIAGENYWERFKNYLLKTIVEIPEATVKTEMDSPLREVVSGPWLKFALPKTVEIVLLPSLRQWDNDGGRSRYEAGWDALRSLARKRFGEGGCKRVFGEPDAEGHFPLADKIVDLCGGHFRDLLLLFREMLARTKSLPVTEEVVDAAIVTMRRQFLPIAVENARWLHQIARLRQTALMTDRPEDVNRLTRFLDTHFVLYFTNGEEWYDIHPLIGEEVEAIIAQHGERDEARSG